MPPVTHINGYALNQARFWQFMLEKMEAGVKLMLLYVLESTGSSPGRQGFRMVVSADKEFYGSIGGGIMEHKLVETALDKLHESDSGGLYRQVHDKSAARHQSGMICSGEQTIWMYPVRPDDRNAIQSLYQSWMQLEAGSLVIRPAGLFFKPEVEENDFDFKRLSDEDFILTERCGFRNQLHIIGGGHCSLALCELMSRMDFHITVYDDREGLSTMRHNHFAHHTQLVRDYSELASYVPSGNRVFVCIMTFGYRTDDLALRALAGRPYRYLGMLGSKNKVMKMQQAYREEGLDTGLIGQVHAPIGLTIKSETPEEIAVSIAAELIAVKNGVHQ